MKHKCIVCKKEKGTKGLSFHRFPKDEKQLQLWLKNLEKENCKPSPNSLVCSRHFEPDCLQSVFNRVRLKKGSIPTVFTEQSHASATFEQLSGSKMQVIESAATSSDDVTPCNIIEPLIEPHSSYIKSSEIHEQEITATSSNDTIPCTIVEPLIEPHGSYAESSQIHVLEIAATINKNTAPCTIIEPIIEPYEFDTESSEMQVLETEASSSNDAIPDTESRERVQHDHQYTFTPTNYKKKLLEMQEYIRELRNSKRVLEQKVKRLQATVASLKKMCSQKEYKSETR